MPGPNIWAARDEGGGECRTDAVNRIEEISVFHLRGLETQLKERWTVIRQRGLCGPPGPPSSLLSVVKVQQDSGFHSMRDEWEICDQ